jgi:hypothetical protein
VNCNAIDNRNYDLDGNVRTEEAVEEKEEPEYKFRLML